MRCPFYMRLAWTGIRKNRSLYLPYLFTCAGMIAIFYIVAFLATGGTLSGIKGGSILEEMLGFGTYIIGIFSLFFLLYTSAFVIRRRNKEFGLYNILGMRKWNLMCIMLWESLITVVLSLCCGLGIGIILSKLAEVGLIYIMKSEASFTMHVGFEAIGVTCKIFAGIFFILLLRSLWLVRLSNPLKLLRSENVGEKPPRANYVLALLGVVLLGVSYYLAVTIEEPLKAIVWFFWIVGMVIAATYLLFIAGSVALCRFLQKRRRYYYKTAHFVSVSSMVYRMKRNGAGLASICILCTMVLVTISATACLYLGEMDILRARYPRNIIMKETITGPLEEKKLDTVRETVNESLDEEGMRLSNLQDYVYWTAEGFWMEDQLILAEDAAMELSRSSSGNVWYLYFLDWEAFRNQTNASDEPAPGEVWVGSRKNEYHGKELTISGVGTWRVREIEEEDLKKILDGEDGVQLVSSIYVILPNMQEVVDRCQEVYGLPGQSVITQEWNYGFDLNGSNSDQERFYQRILEKVLVLREKEETYPIQMQSVARDRWDFLSLYGGLFFLGILLGIVFLFAAMLIVYYKQISEGYEDQSRYEIMRKVGMTGEDIRRSIQSQMLTVFLLPLAVAGLHLAFAFPMIQKLLLLFSMSNVRLMILVNAGCILAFGLIYVIVYRATSQAYYRIVSGIKSL